MAPSLTRDRDASRPQRPRTKPATYEQQPSSSPTRTRPKRKSKKSLAGRQQEKEYKTKDQAVLSQKKGKNGNLLVNWADNPETGESYEPSWQPYFNVLQAGLDQWEEQKRQGLTEERGDEIILKDHPYHKKFLIRIERKLKRPSTSDDTESQAESQSQTDLPEQRPSKKPRLASPHQLAATSSSLPTELRSSIEVRDSYEQELPQILPVAREGEARVELAVPADLDRTAYQVVNFVDSSPSQKSQIDTPIHSSPSFDVSKPSTETSPQVRTGPRAQARNISGFVVPDSQDLVASSLYEPSLLSRQSTAEPTQGTRIEDSLALQVSADSHSSRSADITTISLPEESSANSEAPKPYTEANHQKRVTTNTQSQIRDSFLQLDSPSHSQVPVESHTSQSSHLLTPVRDVAASQVDPCPPLSPPEINLGHNQSTLSSSHKFSQHQLPSPSIENGSSVIASPDSSPSPQEQSSIQSQRASPYPVSSHESSWQGAQPLNSTFSFGERQSTSSGVERSRQALSEKLSHSHSPLSSSSLFPSIEVAEAQSGISSPYQSRVPSVTALLSSSPTMDELEAKAARKAARKEKIYQKLTEAWETGYNEAQAEAEARRRIAPSDGSPVASVSPQAQLPSATNESSSSQLQNEPLSQRQSPQIIHSEAGPQLNSIESDDNEPISEIEQLELDDNETLDVVAQSENEYFVALPLNAICREIYAEVIGATKKERQAILEDDSLNEELLAKIETMFTNLDLLCNHTDLHSEDYSTQRLDPIAFQARFAENRSTKCIFFAELLLAMRTFDKHIAVVARPGRMLEILEAILQYHDFFKQSNTTHILYHFKNQGTTLKVSIIPSGSSDWPYPAADLVVAFDSTFTREAYLTNLRTKALGRQPSPLIHLVIASSIEHLEKVFPDDIDALERRIRIVGCISIIKGDIGKVEIDPGEAAKDVMNFVLDETDDATWPCPKLPIIESVQVYASDLRSNNSTSSPYQPLSSAAASFPATSVLRATATKRQLDDDGGMEVDTPKRQRLTPIPGEKLSPASQSISSTPFSAIPVSFVENSLQPSTSQNQALEKQKIDVQQTARRTEEEFAEVCRLNQSLQNQIDDLRKSLAVIPPKFQEALNDRAQFESQAKKAVEEAQKMQKKFDSQQEEIRKLKEQNSNMAEELKKALDVMANSTIPEFAHLGTLEQKIKSLEADKEKLERQKQSAAKELDYMRTAYQNGSAADADQKLKIKALEKEREVLKRKASENLIRVHEIQSQNDKAGYLRMLNQTKLEKQELERQLERKSSELANVMNGRRPTRGQSVPMSPRVLSPMGAPNGGNNGFVGQRGNISRVIQQTRSRGTSPAVVDRGTSGGGPQTFGDLLPNAGSRFGETKRG